MSLFGDYIGTMGARLYDSNSVTTFTSLNSGNITYSLNEPTYDSF